MNINPSNHLDDEIKVIEASSVSSQDAVDIKEAYHSNQNQLEVQSNNHIPLIKHRKKSNRLYADCLGLLSSRKIKIQK